MRTGAEYRESLRDGRNVWVMGEGSIADVTTHPATSAMVEEYVKWYDRHLDSEWQETLLTQPGAKGERRPLAFEIPKTSVHLQNLGKALRAGLFASGGNMTHTPGYGALIALGMLTHLTGLDGAREEIEAAEKYRETLARSGRFLTFAGGGPLIGTRLRQDPEERVALRLEKETDQGIVVSGKVQMHTSTPFAEDVLITSRDELPPGSGRWLWFIVPVNAPGVRVVARRSATRHGNPFLSPLSSRFDELDALLWLKEVFIPRERVFAGEPLSRNKRHSLVSWLLWHHNCGWLAKAELTLGLGLALAEVMGLKENPATIEQLVDLAVDVQTSRTCITAAELEPEMTSRGHAVPGPLHLAASAVNIFRSRQRMSEILRGLPGSSLVNAPADTDFTDPIMAAELEDAFGGGGYTALQRAALLQLAWDQVASGLDGREAAFELHASGGMAAWRGRLRAWFQSYDELANGVQQFLGVQLPVMDLSSLQEVPNERPRRVTPP
ncbi:MAG: 4-hydroxyphenylacetate 3-hydroxylase N-terminal domain-containing protein [Dehalococcoidia bacterium]